MSVTAESVKLLRERTGAGMMECKRALVETNGDLDAAAELMRKQGLAKADRKAARVAAEGVVSIAQAADGRTAALVEVNCETDFVARGEDFRAFADAVAAAVLAKRPSDLGELAALPLASGESVEDRRRVLVAKIGENLSVRRFAIVESPGILAAYLHGTRIGALVALEGGGTELARDLAMHVAAINPQYLAFDDVPADLVAKEREIAAEQAQKDAAGKPAEIVAKIVDGKVRKSLAAITLLGQPFVRDDKVTVEKLLAGARARVAAFERYEVGAGIERKQGDFVAEVMAQAKGASAGKH
jgi:elongation factor Ts